jgi:hypothetical protein
MIDVLDTGIIYRNPKPHLRAAHTWHPSLVHLGGGELVASFDIGEAVEALNYRTWLARSTDGGRTWSEPARLLADAPGRRSVHTARIARMADGSLTAFGGRMWRDDPEEGLVNRANLGYVPMELFLLRSRDGGRSWEGPQAIEPPLAGPAFEICHPLVELRDGRWLAPTSTWRGWNGDAPNGMKAVALVSHDRGRTWPEYLDVMDRYAEGVITWEQSLRQLGDGRLLAVAWWFNERTGRTEPTPYALSDDGRRFSAPRPTGLRSQTAKLLVLPDDRILCLYRRDDRPGLWANLSHIEGDRWVNVEERVLWQGAVSGMSGAGTNSDELSGLRFGYPTLALMPDSTVLAAFWCQEDAINNVRWIRLRV